MKNGSQISTLGDTVDGNTSNHDKMMTRNRERQDKSFNLRHAAPRFLRDTQVDMLVKRVWITHAGGVEADPSKSAPVKGNDRSLRTPTLRQWEAEDEKPAKETEVELSDTGQQLRG